LEVIPQKLFQVLLIKLVQASAPSSAKMEAPQRGELADPIAKGTFATAKQSLGDLFKWKQRTAITNGYGETYCEWRSPEPLRNPISLCRMLTLKAWVFFIVGLAAWTADAFDFHALSIQTVKLAKYYDTSKTNVTTAITLTLLLRSVGAAFFGIAGDKWGRKYPMVFRLRQYIQQPSANSSQCDLSSGCSWGVSMATPLPWRSKTAPGRLEVSCRESFNKATLWVNISSGHAD
jgi:hypothetical protein